MDREMTAQQAELIVPERIWSSSPCDGDQCSVSGVDLVMAGEVMTALRDADGNFWRLPTEAEWEYAARGGENFAYAGSDVAEEVGWTGLNTDTEQEGCLLPRNGYGLCDMTGNDEELTLDAASVSFNGITDVLAGWTSDPVTDPQRVPTISGRYMIIRGGSVRSASEFNRLCARRATEMINRLGANSVATMRLARDFEAADLLPAP
jgi:formylglycine-generating enzyme required for sulfatase activity